MKYELGVWFSDAALTVEEAWEIYASLFEGDWVPEEAGEVEEFYEHLHDEHPEVTPENRSGGHMIFFLEDSAMAEGIAQLACSHGLVCFDPQEPAVHCPSCLQD